MRLAALFATPILALTLHAQGRVLIQQPRVNLGQVDAAGGPVPFTFTVTNAGSEALKLQWLDFGDPAILAEITKGLLRPGESTAIRGSLDARHLVGRFTGRIELHAEDVQSPITTLEITALIAPDAVITSPATFRFEKLKWREDRAGSTFTFKTRSGDLIDPESVKVTSQAPYLTFTTQVNMSELRVTPVLNEALLPMTATGHTQGLVQIEATEYAVDVTWTREESLVLSPTGNGAFSLKALDGRPFKLGKVISDPKRTFRSKKEGEGYLLTPAPTRKPLPIKTLTVMSTHPLKPSITWRAPASN